MGVFTRTTTTTDTETLLCLGLGVSMSLSEYRKEIEVFLSFKRWTDVYLMNLSGRQCLLGRRPSRNDVGSKTPFYPYCNVTTVREGSSKETV